MSATDRSGERQNGHAGTAERRDQGQEASVEITRILQRGRTLRTLIICATVVAGVAIVAYAITEIVADPRWWQLVGVIVLSLIAPGGVIARLLKSRRKYVKKTHRRTTELEQRTDPERSSSLDERD